MQIKRWTIDFAGPLETQREMLAKNEKERDELYRMLDFTGKTNSHLIGQVVALGAAIREGREAVAVLEKAHAEYSGRIFEEVTE